MILGLDITYCRTIDSVVLAPFANEKYPSASDLFVCAVSWGVSNSESGYER
jgi:hypothetical protein